MRPLLAGQIVRSREDRVRRLAAQQVDADGRRSVPPLIDETLDGAVVMRWE